MNVLFSKANLGSLTLNNHIVMSPMTRNRAINNVPSDMIAEYYQQRATAGLIITEGTSPSPHGLGYPRMPGVFSDEQIAGWKKVADAVHGAGGKIFMQVMHCGRIGHELNLPAGAKVMGPSAIAAAGEMYTDAEGMKAHPVPHAMTEAEIAGTIAEFVQAAKNAVAAGCDGIEIHGANGYLIEQFIRPTSNQRTDRYGGSIENRARFLLEIAEGCIAAIGKNKMGVRLSPYGIFNDVPDYADMGSDYAHLAEKLNGLGVVYVHLVDHAPMGAPAVPDAIKATFRKLFKGTLILSGGYDAARAEADLAAAKCDLIGVGRPFIANPDLVRRWETGAALSEPDMGTFYTPGPKGFTDYPVLAS